MKPKRKPFSIDEWCRWRDDCLAAEATIGRLAAHVEVVYGVAAATRGRQRVRDLAGYRKFVGHLTCDTITDENQLEMFMGSTEAWS